MNNREKLKAFTDRLYELYVEQRVDLTRSLEILMQNRNVCIKTTAEELLNSLKEGCAFSSALSKCNAIRFDSGFVAFVRYSESTGNLEKILSYLKNRENRREEAVQKIKGAAIYPLMVILLTFFAVGGFFFYGREYFDLKNLVTTEMIANLLLSCISVFIACGIFLVYIINALGEDSLYEAFVAIDFMVQGGIGIKASISYGLLSIGLDSKYGKRFMDAHEKIKAGYSLFEAFNWNTKLSEAFFFAQKAGTESRVFEKICCWMEQKNEAKRRLCLSIIEPVFIGLTGLLLFLLVLTFVLPVMSGSLEIL